MHWLLTGPLSVEKLTVKIQDLPASLKGVRIVQMSDFHYDGLRLSEKMLEKAIIACNKAEPDLVVFTGDYVTDDPAPINQLVLRLKHLQSRCGTYAVLGNHDIYYPHSKAEIAAAFNRVGIELLDNKIAYPLGKELALVGLAEYWSSDFNPGLVMNQLDPATPRIVLSHNPDTADILRQWRVDLQLSGHTHGGHIVIPGVGPAIAVYNNIVRSIPRKLRRRMPFVKKEFFQVIRNWQWAQGFHQIGTNQLYVNRGLGTYLPGRFFCNPEVTLITLERG
ncbi:metallophosphoesterase [Rivularia sp. UHCC 0363]|uniref:metallophosphoesterase n=1 Tax=Rivularia sp. UHCC 0363 TaxID=3110244 RepID=UPI002B1F8F9F|nr:metallophosphoesterase [Rivularia sp. UHCC 0363]MEA5595822.1 metallophosphoesterase [Rivularia sp. UHCC 0363]